MDILIFISLAKTIYNITPIKTKAGIPALSAILNRRSLSKSVDNNIVYTSKCLTSFA